MDQEVLRRRLAEIKDSGGAEQVLLRADRDVPYGVVAKIVATIREAGIEGLGLVTKPSDSSRKRHKRSKPEKNVKGDSKPG